MKKQKFYVTGEKWLILVHLLNDFRNKRIAESKCLDTVNDTILAVVNPETKRVKIAG